MPPRLPGRQGLDPAVAGERPQPGVAGHRLDDSGRVKLGHVYIMIRPAARRKYLSLKSATSADLAFGAAWIFGFAAFDPSKRCLPRH